MSLLKLLCRLDRNRFHSTVTSMMQPGKIGCRIEELGLPVRSLALKRGVISPSALFRYAQDLKRDHPDILMTWLYHSDLLGILAGKMARIPTIVWNLRASEMDMSQYSKLSGLTLRLCSALSFWPDAIIANSESGKAFHSRIGYRPPKWAVLRNGVDHELFRPDPVARARVRKELQVRPGEIVIGMVARFDPMKDHENFLVAAEKVALQAPQCRFLLAGNDVTENNPRFGKRMNSTPLEGRLLLLGERNDIPQLMAALDIACSSSCSEAFPNVVAEAMSCGLPCVATDVGDTADLLGGTGILVRPRDAEALSKGLLKAVAMGRGEREELGGAARRRAIEHFGLQRFVRDYESFIADAVKK